MAVLSREKRGRCLFPPSTAVSCSWGILGIRRVNKKCQRLSTLTESQLAGWLLGTAHNFSVSSCDSLSICFRRGDLNKTSAVWCEHPGGSALSLGEAPAEWKHHEEDDLELRNTKICWQLWQLEMS